RETLPSGHATSGPPDLGTSLAVILCADCLLNVYTNVSLSFSCADTAVCAHAHNYDATKNLHASAESSCERGRDARCTFDERREPRSLVPGEAERDTPPPWRRPLLRNRATLNTPQTADRRTVAIRIETRCDRLADCGAEVIEMRIERPHDDR